MNLDSLRQFCLSFPGARENLQWGDDLCFKIGGKIFAILAVDPVPPKLCLKCAPEKFSELTEYEEIIPAPYLGRYKWVLFQRLDVLRDAELQDLICESYGMVSAKVKPAKKKSRAGKKKAKKKLKKEP
jgi:predicted DNA-binding protein (MmcQ/YjbR family)